MKTSRNHTLIVFFYNCLANEGQQILQGKKKQFGIKNFFLKTGGEKGFYFFRSQEIQLIAKVEQEIIHCWFFCVQ